MMNNDPHHCRCFSIDPDDIDDFKVGLENLGFNYELEKDHGQVLGLALRVEDDLQLHIKVMQDGNIEAEMEPPPAYPFAHLNSEHSYSAHHELSEVLRAIPIKHHKKIIPPITCLRRQILKPDNPTHAKTIAGLAILAVGVGALLYYLTKKDNRESL